MTGVLKVNVGGTWVAVPGAGGAGTPGGAAPQVQFNDGGVFGGDPVFVYDKALGQLRVLHVDAAGWLEGEQIKAVNYAEVGAIPAQNGVIRVPNNTAIMARNAANTADVSLVQAGSDNSVIVGSGAAAVVLPVQAFVTQITASGAGFIGNGSGLTNLPLTPVDLGAVSAEGTFHNLALTSRNQLIRIQGSVPSQVVNFTGFYSGTTGSAAVTGDRVRIENWGLGQVKILHEQGSTDAYRTTTSSQYGQTLGPGGAAELTYSGTRWRTYLIDPGAPIDFTPTPVYFTGGTVHAAWFQQRGTVLHVAVTIAGFNTGGGGTEMAVQLPNGAFAASKYLWQSCQIRCTDGAFHGTGVVRVNAADTYLRIYRNDFTSWGAGNNNEFSFSFSFQIY